MAEEAPECGTPSGRARFRVVLYLVLGLAAVDAAVAARSRVWRAYDPDEYREKPRACRSRANDLVIVGGSPVCEGLDTARLAGASWRGKTLETAYNLGLSGATTSEVWHAVAHGVGAPPRLLVYGITASDLNDGRDEPEGPRVLMTAGDVAVWLRLRPEAAEWCLRHYTRGRFNRAWSLFHFRNGIRLWAADCVERLRPGTCPEAAEEAREGLRYADALRRPDGYAPRPDFQAGSLVHMRAVGKVPERFPFLEKYRVGGHLRYLHRLLDWAEAGGVDVVLVDMPVSAELERRFEAAFATYRATLAEVERTRGVTVLRASRAAVGLDDEDFADLIHLNARGADRLSDWVRGHLSESREGTP